MIIVDTNIFIYLAQGQLKPDIFNHQSVAFASISKIELLGFPRITAVEERFLSQILENYQMIDLINPVIDQAIILRQDRNMSLGDAIIAASALEYDFPLWTANTADFQHISGLTLVNPFER